MHDRQQGELVELSVEDNARLTETQTAQPGEQPVVITGRRVHVKDANRPQAAADVVGTPAHFQGRGINLSGPNINLNKGQNRVWVDGPGQMDLPVDHDLEGRPLASPGRVQIDWLRKMTFDGLTAHFEDSVTARQATELLRTQTLEARFRQKVNFADPKAAQQPQVAQILCWGGAFLENYTIEAGQQTAHDRLEAADLKLDTASGDLLANGPGWLTSTRRGAPAGATAGGTGILPMLSPRAPATTPGPSAIGPPLPPANGQAVRPAGIAGARSGPPPDPNQLTCIHLRFLGSITGNVRRKEMTFHEQVHAAYSPVQDWLATLEGDDPRAFGPQAIILRSDHLTVVDMTPPGGDKSAEMLAFGNVVAEGAVFTARASRMTYSQANGLLVLDGDGRTDAELFRQEHPGSTASHFTARRILYWPKINQAKVDGVRTLELNQYPNGEVKSGARLPPGLNR
jgi:hypothetical protein